MSAFGVGSFEGADKGFGFVYAFLEFANGVGVRDYAAAGLNVRDAVLDNHSAQGDAGIEIAREIEIENSPGVDAAARFFEFLDDFHGPDLWRAGNSARRKTSHQRVETIHIFAQSAPQTGNQVHDMRIAL